MLEYRRWTGPPAPAFARFWYAMLEECDLLGAGAVDDWETRLLEHFSVQAEAGLLEWFVAREGENIVATCAVFQTAGHANILKDRTATLAGVFVTPAFRRRGIARELTARAVEWCRQGGIRTIRLQSSRAARALYSSLGFVATGEQMRLQLR